MTRIVFCDLDNTLLPAGRDRIDAETLAQIKRITDKGIHFCVASGRPYSQLKKLFGLKGNVIFTGDEIAKKGAQIQQIFIHCFR